MTGIKLGDFTVGIIPEVSPAQLRAELQQGEQLAKRMPLRVPIKLDDASLKSETRRLTAELQKGAVLKIKLDSSAMPAELKRIQQQLGSVASIRVQVKDSGRALNDLRQMDNLVKSLGSRMQYRVTVNTSALEAVHSRINTQVQQLTALLAQLRAAGGGNGGAGAGRGTPGSALPAGTANTIREIERLNNLWQRGQINAENYNSALTAMQSRLQAAAQGATRGSAEFAQIDRALTRVTTSLRSINTDSLVRIRADASALRLAFDSATAGVQRNSAGFRQAAQTYSQGAQQLEARLQSLTRQAQLTPQQLRQVNQQLAQLAREQNTIAGRVNHAGLSGNIVNAGGALGQGAGAGLTMMGGGLGMVAAQGAMVAAAMNSIYQSSGKAGLALGGVGLAAIGAVGALGSLGTVGLSEVKKVETATNILKANGAPNIEAFQGQLEDLKESLGGVGDSFTKGDFGLATADIVKAGVESADALTLMTSSTKLAAAEQINLTEASGLLLKNLRQYDYEVGDAARVGDMLAMAGNAAAGTAYDLSVGLGIVGGTGKQAKLEMYDLLGMLVELDNKGMSAADVGANGLRAALSALSDITKKGQVTLGDLTIAMVDAEGKARPAGDILKDLGEKMRGMGVYVNKTTGELDGNGEAMQTVSSLMDNRAAAAVINLTGDWEKWSQQIKDSGGYLDEYANTMQEGVEPALKGLKNAWADTGAEFAKSFAGPLTTFLNETLNPFVKKLGEMFEILGKGNKAEIMASLQITPEDNGTAQILKVLTAGAYTVADFVGSGGLLGNPQDLENQAVNAYRASRGLPPLGANAGQVGAGVLNGSNGPMGQQASQAFTYGFISNLKDTFRRDPRVGSDCAIIAYEILNAIGAEIKGTAVQNAWVPTLEANAKASGFERVQGGPQAMRPGDLIIIPSATSGSGKHAMVFAGWHNGKAMVIHNPGTQRNGQDGITTVYAGGAELANAAVYRAPVSPFTGGFQPPTAGNRTFSESGAVDPYASGGRGRSVSPTGGRTPEQRAQDLYDQLKEAEASRNAGYIALVNKKVRDFVAEGYSELWDATKTANKSSGRSSSQQTPMEREQAAQAEARAMDLLEGQLRNATTDRLREIVGSDVGPNLSLAKWELAGKILEERETGRPASRDQTPAERQAADRARQQLEANIRNKSDAQLAVLVGGTVGQNGLTYETWELAVREQEGRRTGKRPAELTPLQREQQQQRQAVRTERLQNNIRAASPERLQEIVAGGVTPEISLEHWEMARDEIKRRGEVADREEEKRAKDAEKRAERVAEATEQAQRQMTGYTVGQAQARAEVEQGNLDRFLAGQRAALDAAGEDSAERLRILEEGADEELTIRTNLLTAQLIAGKRANEQTRQNALDGIPEDAPEELRKELEAAINAAFDTENTRLYTAYADGLLEATRTVEKGVSEATKSRTADLARESKAVRDTVEGYEDLARNAQATINAGQWDEDAARDYARSLRALGEAADEAGIAQNTLVVGAQAAAELLGNTAQAGSDAAATWLGAAAAEIAVAGRLVQQGDTLGAVMGLENLITLLEEGPQTDATRKAISLLNDELERMRLNMSDGDWTGIVNTLAAIREGPEESAVAALPSAEDRARQQPTEMDRVLGRGEAQAGDDQAALQQYGLDREKVRWTEEKAEALRKMTAAELAQRRAELERIGDSRALLELQMIDTLETERATTATDLLASAKAELDGLNKVSIPSWEALADKLEEQAELGGKNAEKLRELAAALREAGQASQSLEQLTTTLQEIQRGLDFAGDLFTKMNGGEMNWGTAAMNWASGGITAFTQYMSGDIAGAVMTSINMIGDLGQAIMDLSPAFREWKTQMLEVAQTQREALGLNTGGFISPWQKQLEEDAAAREKQANAGFWQRVSWSLFGGAPKVMKTESAKLLAELQTIFAELGSGMANIFSSSMESAFLEGDMTRWAENFDKTFDEMVGKLIIKTMVEAAIQQGAVANDLAALTKAIQEQRYGDIPSILTSIKSNARLALQPIADVAPSLPGFGSGRTDEQGRPLEGDLFGAAPSIQLGIPRIEVQLPAVMQQGMTDFAASVPEFRAGARELLLGAQELRAALRGNGNPPALTGLGAMT
ncbi:phage tail tape measure protein [Deinococcus radiophilus]|uniref:Phage tail tape measure protein n=2 Tax=Deinococcus radiophilus TaxID=32062 RepID=A0A431W0N6_9DEIO|nr:phage tail tape measure protein [Deinococcus radiophilus]RTR29071.1 phage tail tape measure protein [Deinococcus radiophilus]